MNIINELAQNYVDFLNQDNGVVSKSHIVMHGHLRTLKENDQKRYHATVSKLLNPNSFNELIERKNPGNRSMTDCDYYHWLKAGNYQDNSLKCKTAYLEKFGFVKGINTISEKNIRILQWIGEQYFRNEIVPTLKPLETIE